MNPAEVERVRADINFSIGKGDAIGWVYVAKGLIEVIDESLLREASLEDAARDLVDAMETCHICKGVITVDGGPVHCEDCSWDCEEHDPPSCVTLDIIHARLKRLIESGTGSETQQAKERRQFAADLAALEEFDRYWEEHEQYGCTPEEVARLAWSAARRESLLREAAQTKLIEQARKVFGSIPRELMQVVGPPYQMKFTPDGFKVFCDAARALEASGAGSATQQAGERSDKASDPQEGK